MSALPQPRISALEGRESVIAGALRAFVDVGRALGEIRDGELYKERGYRNFDAYCKERWGWSRSMADKSIASARSALLIADNCPQIPAPLNEAQARPLTLLPENDQPAVWAAVVESAPSGRVTAKHVEAVVRAHLQPTPIKDDPFHILIAAGEMKERIRALAEKWPLAARCAFLPTVLRDLATEYEEPQS